VASMDKGAEQYASDLEKNLKDLLDRAKSETYRAPPVRRVHIPKDNGEARPLGIPTFEDKVWLVPNGPRNAALWTRTWTRIRASASVSRYQGHGMKIDLLSRPEITSAVAGVAGNDAGGRPTSSDGPNSESPAARLHRSVFIPEAG